MQCGPSLPSLRSRPLLLGRDAGDLTRPVPVDREQHRSEHGAIVLVELVADGGDHLLAVPGGFWPRQAATAARARASSPGMSSRYLTAARASLSRAPVSRIPQSSPYRA